MKIPLYRPNISIEDKQAVLRVLDSGCLVRGEETANLEKAFAKFVNKKYALAVSSGTAALHLALLGSSNIGQDEVILSPFTFIADANVILYERLKPHFVDVNPITLGCNIENLNQSISDGTSHVILSHMFGLCAYDSENVELLKNLRVSLIEDVCQSIFLPNSKGNLIGKLNSILVYSFADNKIITSGQGGMLAMDDEKVFTRIKSLRDQGRNFNENWLDSTLLGYNYKITEMQAALAFTQLKNIEASFNDRKKSALMYQEHLQDITEIALPDKFEERSYFNFFIKLNSESKRDSLFDFLKSKDITTRKSMPPCPLFNHVKQYGYKSEGFAIARDMASRIIELPMYVGMTSDEVEYICNHIKAGLKCH